MLFTTLKCSCHTFCGANGNAFYHLSGFAIVSKSKVHIYLGQMLVVFDSMDDDDDDDDKFLHNCQTDCHEIQPNFLCSSGDD